MDRLVILHNEYNVSSSLFVGQYSSSYQVIKFIPADNKNSLYSSYIENAELPSPANYPAVVDTKNKVIVNNG